MNKGEIWNCGNTDHFGIPCQDFISRFIFPFNVDLCQNCSRARIQKLEIMQRNHNLLPTYVRNVGLLNLLVYFASQNWIWWGFYWLAPAFLYHRGHTPWCVFLPNKLLHNSQAVDVGRIHGVSPNYFLHCARSWRCKKYSFFKSWLRRQGYR